MLPMPPKRRRLNKKTPADAAAAEEAPSEEAAAEEAPVVQITFISTVRYLLNNSSVIF